MDRGRLYSVTIKHSASESCISRMDFSFSLLDVAKGGAGKPIKSLNF